MAGPGYEAEIPERGYFFLGNSVRRQEAFSRQEVEAAIARYFELAKHGTTTGDWNPWADIFTDDAIYVEHSYGIMRGREAIRSWVTTVTGARVTDLEVVPDWYTIDNDLCVIYTINRHPAPDGGAPYQFIGLSVFCYAGEGLWCYEEDVTNSGEIERVHKVYAAAKAAWRA
jgi:SnoaL-like domain